MRTTHQTISKVFTVAILMIATNGIGGDRAIAEPRFKIERRAVGEEIVIAAWWNITNTQESALVIKSVVLNGEFSCKRGRKRGAVYYAKESFPQSIGIGETVYAMEYHGNTPEKVYNKEVIFVDVETNSGTFRYNVSDRAIAKK